MSQNQKMDFPPFKKSQSHARSKCSWWRQRRENRSRGKCHQSKKYGTSSIITLLSFFCKPSFRNGGNRLYYVLWIVTPFELSFVNSQKHWLALFYSPTNQKETARINVYYKKTCKGTANFQLKDGINKLTLHFHLPYPFTCTYMYCSMLWIVFTGNQDADDDHHPVRCMLGSTADRQRSGRFWFGGQVTLRPSEANATGFLTHGLCQQLSQPYRLRLHVEKLPQLFSKYALLLHSTPERRSAQNCRRVPRLVHSEQLPVQGHSEHVTSGPADGKHYFRSGYRWPQWYFVSFWLLSTDGLLTSQWQQRRLFAQRRVFT